MIAEKNILTIDTNNYLSSVNAGGEDAYENREIVARCLRDSNAPLVSIILLTYNHLEDLAKSAVESIIKYTSHIDIELIPESVKLKH